MLELHLFKIKGDSNPDKQVIIKGRDLKLLRIEFLRHAEPYGVIIEVNEHRVSLVNILQKKDGLR